MDLEIIILSKLDRERQLLYVESKNDTNELIYNTETDSTDIENKLMVTKGEGGGGINELFGISRYTLLYIK